MNIDTFLLARTGASHQGDVPLSRLERLLNDLPEQAENSLVTWKAVGESDSSGRLFMRLQLQVVVAMICQRCMESFDYPVWVDTKLEIVQSESELTDENETDVALDDDAPDQIVGSHRFDMLELIEDELIMAVPYVPRHDVCVALPGQDDDSTQNTKPSPFAALASLKKI